MYVDSSTIKKNGKEYTRHLLRTSYRENKKVKHKTIANITECSKDEIAAIKLALKHKKNLNQIGSLKEVKTVLGKRIGSVWTLYSLAERLGIKSALGNDESAKKALLQVIIRCIDQGSRLSAVRFAQRHAISEIIGIKKLDEDDLYENLTWLSNKQEVIEKKLFNLRYPDLSPTLFLYDVTSSYLEGMCNELADWGYNRDKKRGKKQIVVGLLAAADGLPVAVRVFKGNTNDTATVSEQVRTLSEAFGIEETILVGDRGMLKGPQIDMLPDGFRYITAISKPQIMKMLREQVIQYELFDDKICEVVLDNIRYILRRNPVRAKQISENRNSKLFCLKKYANDCTKYLKEHKKADTKKALEKVTAKIKKLGVDKWLSATECKREISIHENAEGLGELTLLDGCYVIKSDVPADKTNMQTLHDRYCDLEMVERSFRTMKTTHLEMRPVYVRKESNTRGYALVVMLALLLQRELEKCWRDLDITVKEGIDELSSIRMQEVRLGETRIQDIPTPDKLGKQLLKKVQIKIPPVLPFKNANVHTKKKLHHERKYQ